MSRRYRLLPSPLSLTREQGSMPSVRQRERGKNIPFHAQRWSFVRDICGGGRERRGQRGGGRRRAGTEEQGPCAHLKRKERRETAEGGREGKHRWTEAERGKKGGELLLRSSSPRMCLCPLSLSLLLGRLVQHTHTPPPVQRTQ